MIKTYEASGKTVDEAIDIACALAGTSIENVEVEILELGSKGFLGLGQKDARVRISVDEPEVAEKPAPRSNGGFGPKKNRREKREKKPAAADIEIKPIQVIDPASVIEPELRTPRPARKDHNEHRDNHRQDERPRIKEEQSEKEQPRRESNATDITEGEMEKAVFEAARSFAEPIFSAMGVTPQYRTEIREGILWIILSGEKLGLLIGRRGETLNAIQYLVNLAVNKRRSDHVRIVIDVEGYRESREQTLTALAHKMAEKAVRTGRRVELEPMNPHERRIVHIALQNDKRVETTSHGEEPYRRVVVTSRRRNKKRGGNRREKSNDALPNVIIQHDTDNE